MLLNRADSRFWNQEGVYIAFSHDLVSWTSPEKILESNDWYPQVVGLGANGTDSVAGRFVRLFIGGVSRYVMEFTRLPGTAASPVSPLHETVRQDTGPAVTGENETRQPDARTDTTEAGGEEPGIEESEDEAGI
jgi:hypothetical protein